MKKIVTQEDLDKNPALIEKGINLGDEIETTDFDDFESDDDTGGSTPPPNKGRG